MNTVISIISILSTLLVTTNTLPPVSGKSTTSSQVARNLVKKSAGYVQSNTKTLHKLSSKAPQLNKNVLKMALVAYNKAQLNGSVKKPVLTVIDYSLPSNKQRMWIFDLKNQKLLYSMHVAHGKNSGSNSVPRSFSNTHSSKQSSLGTYITKDTYIGNHGYSLNLQGLERGFNDNAYKRRVVVHGAWYVEPTFIKNAGRAGNSWGCLAIADTLSKPVINTIKNGSVMFAYYPSKQYLSKSKYAKA